MAAHGWNSLNTNIHRYGRELSRPYRSRHTAMLACRICEKIFLSAYSLIEHYETHEGQFAQNRQTHHRSHCLLNQNDINLVNNPFRNRTYPLSVSQQRHLYHPYISNGHRALQQQGRERNTLANANSPFLGSTQNPQICYTRNQTIGNSRSVPVSSSYTLSITRSSAVGNNQSLTHLRIGHPMSSKYATLTSLGSNQKLTCSLRVEDQKGYDESGDKRTIWYLGKLEQPIPIITDPEGHEERNEYFKLN